MRPLVYQKKPFIFIYYGNRDMGRHNVVFLFPARRHFIPGMQSGFGVMARFSVDAYGALPLDLLPEAG